MAMSVNNKELPSMDATINDDIKLLKNNDLNVKYSFFKP